MNFIPQEDVYESPEYSGPMGLGMPINVNEWDDTVDMPIAQGFEIPMSYTDEQLASLRGMPNFYSDTNLSDNIRSAYMEGEDYEGPLLSDNIRGALQSAPSYVRRRRKRRKYRSSSYNPRPKWSSYPKKRKFSSKRKPNRKRKTLTKKRRYKKSKSSTVVYIR